MKNVLDSSHILPSMKKIHLDKNTITLLFARKKSKIRKESIAAIFLYKTLFILSQFDGSYFFEYSLEMIFCQ